MTKFSMLDDRAKQLIMDTVWANGDASFGGSFGEVYLKSRTGGTPTIISFDKDDEVAKSEAWKQAEQFAGICKRHRGTIIQCLIDKLEQFSSNKMATMCPECGTEEVLSCPNLDCFRCRGA